MLSWNVIGSETIVLNLSWTLKANEDAAAVSEIGHCSIPLSSSPPVTASLFRALSQSVALISSTDR